MTNPVLNQQSPLVSVRDKNNKEIGKGFIIPPWNSFFQQSTQKAPKVANVTQNPYQANANGTVIITTGTAVKLTRGPTVITLGNGLFIIPINISDIVSWGSAATVQFLGSD
jgi:hypothetical protein